MSVWVHLLCSVLWDSTLQLILKIWGSHRKEHNRLLKLTCHSTLILLIILYKGLTMDQLLNLKHVNITSKRKCMLCLTENLEFFLKNTLIYTIKMPSLKHIFTVLYLISRQLNFRKISASTFYWKHFLHTQLHKCGFD